MIPTNRRPTHPGEILQEEFLSPLWITQVALAAHIGVPVQRINELVRGKRGVTPDTAWLLTTALSASYLGLCGREAGEVGGRSSRAR